MLWQRRKRRGPPRGGPCSVYSIVRDLGFRNPARLWACCGPSRGWVHLHPTARFIVAGRSGRALGPAPRGRGANKVDLEALLKHYQASSHVHLLIGLALMLCRIRARPGGSHEGRARGLTARSVLRTRGPAEVGPGDRQGHRVRARNDSGLPRHDARLDARDAGTVALRRGSRRRRDRARRAAVRDPTQDTVFEHFAAVAHAPRSLWARGRYAWPASGRVRGRGRAPFREARRLTSRPKAAAKTPQ